jgi:hypothetical protein
MVGGEKQDTGILQCATNIDQGTTLRMTRLTLEVDERPHPNV